MKRQIFKYGPLAFGQDVEILGKPLHLGYQGSVLYIWCEVIGDDPKDERRIEMINPRSRVRIYGTGEQYNGDWVDTVIDEAGFVWHAVVRELEYIYDESGFVIGSTEKRTMQ